MLFSERGRGRILIFFFFKKLLAIAPLCSGGASISFGIEYQFYEL